MVAVELLYDSAAPRNAGDVRGAKRERLDHCHEAARVLPEAEIRRHIRGAPRSRLVPGDDRKLVGQGVELRLPHAAVLGSTVHEHQRRPLADALVGDLEPVRPDDLHRRNLHMRRRQKGSAEARCSLSLRGDPQRSLSLLAQSSSDGNTQRGFSWSSKAGLLNHSRSPAAWKVGTIIVRIVEGRGDRLTEGDRC